MPQNMPQMWNSDIQNWATEEDNILFLFCMQQSSVLFFAVHLVMRAKKMILSTRQHTLRRVRMRTSKCQEVTIVHYPQPVPSPREVQPRQVSVGRSTIHRSMRLCGDPSFQREKMSTSFMKYSDRYVIHGHWNQELELFCVEPGHSIVEYWIKNGHVQHL